MLYVLIVIHNRTCGESIACQSLKEQDDGTCRILIYDNSDSDLGIKAECVENGWTYLGGKGNKGLPIAYNTALDYLKGEKAEGYICLLDDDTRLNTGFISDIKSAALTCDADILLPLVTQNGRILSPWKETGRRYFKSFNESSSFPQNRILAFNSGMTISLDVFTGYRYDETLFLDCVDISFLTEMKKRGKKIVVVPAYCEQCFSGLERPPKDKAMHRFTIYSGDMRSYYGKYDIICSYMLLKRAAHLAMIYATARPFAVLFRKSLMTGSTQQ